jgi:enoyl-CoA hydratase/carnithine racemase
MRKLLLEIDNGIAAITLNSPKNFNALDAAMAADLVAALREIDARDDVRVVVLRGAGKAFCAGGDIAWFAQAGDAIHDTINALGPHIQRVVHWRHTPVIVVAVVQGRPAAASA